MGKPPGLAPPPPSIAGETLPRLPVLFGRIAEALGRHEAVGLLSLTVLQRKPLGTIDAWPAYEAMIREVSSFLLSYGARYLRHGDSLFEAGTSGNAFVLLLEPPRRGGRPGPADLGRVRARIERALSAHLVQSLPREVLEGFGCYVGGVVLACREGIPLERALYRALEEAFASALREKDLESRRRLLQLNKVLELGLLKAVYQPVVDVGTGEVVGFEALSRVSRGRFETIQALFRTAQDHDALWRLERLCRRKALEGAPRLREDQILFLNADPNSVDDPQLLARGFLEQVAQAGLRPDQLVFELTEQSAVRDFASFRRTLLRLRSLGFRLALDDVGSAYSGLHSIAEIAPDYIKADMSLVRDVHQNSLKRELIATIRRFADQTGIQLIAEGVERAEELEALREVGVRWAQGYLFAPPAPRPEGNREDPLPS